MKVSDQYTKLVEWPEEDQCYIGKELHKALAIKAAKSGESLNNLCTDLLRNSLTHKG